MASTNQSPQYQKAESKFLTAETNQEKLKWLDEMIRECPKHKSAEKMLAQLRTRKKKLLNSIEKSKKIGKSSSGKSVIKKEELQAAIIGKTNSGKSSLLKILTNAEPKISETLFTTTYPQIGITHYQGANIQLIDLPALESDYFDKGIANTADVLIILVTNIENIIEIEKNLPKAHGKRIIVFNKSDLLSENEKRKINSTLQSKKYNFVMISTKTKENINELKEKMLHSFNKIRVYTKEPGKEKSNRPLILELDSTIKDVAEKILHGFSKQVKETKIWGPSSKFAGQKVGLKHKLKDLDVVEFKTK